MSEIRVNDIIAKGGTSAPTLVYGAQVPTGMGITGAGGINVTGVVTATSFSGSGSALTGIAVTENVRTDSINVSGVSTFADVVKVSDTTNATSTSTGALIVSGGVGIAASLHVGGSVSIAGTLTHEDVTNVDSVGLITGRAGVNITGGQLQVGAGFSVGAAGVGTFAGNLVVNGDIDLEGDIDVNGTMEADAITVNGSTLASVIEGTTVTTATNSNHVLVTDNESTNENNLITFVEDATSSTGNVGLEMDGNLTYNPSTGNLTATQLTGTLQTAAQTNVTSVGTLAGLTVGSAGEFKVGTAVTISSTSGVSTFANDVVFVGAGGKNVEWDKSNGAFELNDDTRIKIGDSADLSLYHDGSNSYIQHGSVGNLRYQSGNHDFYNQAGDEYICRMTQNSDVKLYYDSGERLATTYEGAQITGFTSTTAGMGVTGGLFEGAFIKAGKLSDNKTLGISTANVFYFTTEETTTCTPDIRWNDSITLNNKMHIGDVTTVTVITTCDANGYSANWTIDGSAVTEEWVGGSAPSEGGSDGLDIYTFTIIKTANATFKVIGNLTNAT